MLSYKQVINQIRIMLRFHTKIFPKFVVRRHGTNPTVTDNSIYDRNGRILLHMLALDDNYKCENVYRAVFTIIKSKKQEHLLLKKDISGNAPLDAAFLKCNELFLNLAKEICDKPSVEELNQLEIPYYHYLGQDGYGGRWSDEYIHSIYDSEKE